MNSPTLPMILETCVNFSINASSELTEKSSAPPAKPPHPSHDGAHFLLASSNCSNPPTFTTMRTPGRKRNRGPSGDRMWACYPCSQCQGTFLLSRARRYLKTRIVNPDAAADGIAWGKSFEPRRRRARNRSVASTSDAGSTVPRKGQSVGVKPPRCCLRGNTPWPRFGHAQRTDAHRLQVDVPGRLHCEKARPSAR